MHKRKRSIDDPNCSLEGWARRRKIKMTTQYQHEFCALPGCGKENKRQEFKFCGRCRIVVYCSTEHQKEHYKLHKSFCRGNEWTLDNFNPTAASSCPLSKCNCKGWPMPTLVTPPSVAPTANGVIQESESDSIRTIDSGFSEIVENSPKHSDFRTLNEDFKKLFHGPLKIQSESLDQAVPVPVNGIAKNSLNGSVNKNKNGDIRTVNNSVQESGPKKRNRKGHSRRQSLPTQNIATANWDCKSTSSKLINNVEEDDLENYAPQCEETVAVSESQSLTVNEPNLSSSSLNGAVNSLYSSSATRQDTGLAEKSVGSSHIEELRNLTVSSPTIPFQHRNNMLPLIGQTPQQNRAWMLQVCKQIIEDMDRFGVCVVDNLLGEIRGGAVLREVQSMYSSGSFTDGQLVKGQRDTPGASQSIRGDKITWVDGNEPHCHHISVLVRLLDNIIMGANSLVNNGKLGNYRIKERSKAMVACYPGSGTQYVKHVDNPNDDGRCVTAIYYLNKDWNTKENGGLLRIFPEGWVHEVADIEPLFDRVIFFWSDRRNPHEVQPAFKTRYAITLWYFDSNAKEAKLRKEINTSASVKAAS